MSKQELISVIIPVFNIEGYLPKCLETITAQSYQNLEIILVDDGSIDSSGQICDSFREKDSRVIVIHQQNMGLWAARNSGQKVAKGNYLIFVDGDDYLHVDAIKTMYETINQNGGYDLAICDRMFTERLDKDNRVEGKYLQTELTQEELIFNMFTHEDESLFVYQWNKLYRRELIEGIWSNAYLRSQDFDYNFRVYLKTKRAVWIHRELYFYVQRPTSLVKVHDAWDIYYECRTKLFYQNYIHLPTDKKQYAHYLLKNLYTKMLFYKNRNYKKTHQAAVFQQCREYEKVTWKAYWRNCHINLIEKIVVTILLHNPWLTHWLMKATKNY